MKEEPEHLREVRAQKDEAILVMLAKLALVYWRPDFTPGQAKELYSQYLEDLRPFAVSAIKSAIQKFRQDGENRFFPTSGQIIDLISGKDALIREFGPNGPTDMGRVLERRRNVAIVAGRDELRSMADHVALLAKPEAAE